MSVLLTGSSQGIGRATAELFLSKGYKVWGLDVLPASVVHENYTHIVCDVSDVNTLPDISGIEYVIFDDVKPNPTCENVNNGLEMLKKEKYKHNIITYFFSDFHLMGNRYNIR